MRVLSSNEISSISGGFTTITPVIASPEYKEQQTRVFSTFGAFAGLFMGSFIAWGNLSHSAFPAALIYSTSTLGMIAGGGLLGAAIGFCVAYGMSTLANSTMPDNSLYFVVQ